MSFPKLALASLAGLLAASPVLAQKAKPKAPAATARRPAARPVAPAPRPEDARLILRLAPEAAVAGQPCTITYKVGATPLAGKAGVRAVVYSFDLDHLSWVARDVALQPGTTAGELTATFTPPATTGFLAFKFVAADGTTDNHHDLGYFQMLRGATQPDRLAPGANLAYGLLRKPDAGYSIPGYFKNFTIGDEALLLWTQEELRFHPENGAALMPQLLGAAQPVLQAKFPAYGRAALHRASRQPSLTETDLLGLEYGYRLLPGGAAQADSLAGVLRQRFPQGYLVRQARFRELSKQEDLGQRLAGWQEFLQAYPPTPAYEAPARYAIDYNKVYQDLILLNMGQQNYPAVRTYAPGLNFNGLLATYYKAVEVSIRPNILSPAQALPYATLLLRRLDSLATRQPAEYAYLSPLEWRAYHAQLTNRSRSHYAALLTELGHYAEARPYADAAQQVANYEDATLNDTQATLLHQGGAADAAELQKVLATSVYHNQASPRMLDWLRESYTAAHPGGTGYDQYLASLQNPATRRAARAALAKQMVKKPIADFALRDLDGHLVRLSTLKGKTVVLDFWATWCVPCKASFPGMKLAQERFRNDPKVVFYFIDTQETEPDYKAQVREYLKAKGFPFKVLFDEKAPGGKTLDTTYKAYGKAYHISGIPQKLVVDPQGRLRFLTDGYAGSPSALADEIVNMVELARTSK